MIIKIVVIELHYRFFVLWDYCDIYHVTRFDYTSCKVQRAEESEQTAKVNL